MATAMAMTMAEVSPRRKETTATITLSTTTTMRIMRRVRSDNTTASFAADSHGGHRLRAPATRSPFTVCAGQDPWKDFRDHLRAGLSPSGSIDTSRAGILRRRSNRLLGRRLDVGGLWHGGEAFNGGTALAPSCLIQQGVDPPEGGEGVCVTVFGMRHGRMLNSAEPRRGARLLARSQPPSES